MVENLENNESLRTSLFCNLVAYLPSSKIQTRILSLTNCFLFIKIVSIEKLT